MYRLSLFGGASLVGPTWPISGRAGQRRPLALLALLAMARDAGLGRGKIVGIHDYTIHDHRHTAAVQLARAGMPLNLIQQQLGHAKITQTMRYSRFHPEYGDVGAYFEEVEERLGLQGEELTPHSSPHPAGNADSE